MPLIKCPTCPRCGSVPPFIGDNFAQAFCINNDCDVLLWTPWDTAEENLNDMHEAVVTSESPRPSQP